MNNKYDVIISGAGPSGSLLGYLLSSQNIKTLVLEKEKFPRFKVCAGGLQHRAAALIPFGVTEVVEKKIKGIYFSYKARKVFNRRYFQPFIYTVDRSMFDQYIALKAQTAGCDFKYQCPVKDFQVEGQKVVVSSPRGVYQSKILVGADGIRGAVHRKIVSGSPVYKILGYDFELQPHLLTSKLDMDDSISIDFGGIKNGYAWIFPRNRSISVGIGGPIYEARSIKKYFSLFLKHHALFRGVKPISKIFAQCIPVRASGTPLCGYRVLAVGDAAGLGDAFTGEGLYNGFFSSILASESIKTSLARNNFSFQDYYEKITDTVYQDIRISKAFSRLFFLFPLVMYNILIKNDKIFEVCCKFIRGERSYRSLVKKLKFLNY